MKILILPRYVDEDNCQIWHAGINSGWTPRRFDGYIPPDISDAKQIAMYGDAIMAQILGEKCGVQFISPPLDWLTTLPEIYLHRRVQAHTEASFEQPVGRWFIKPADIKWFRAGVYEDEQVDLSGCKPDDVILVSEVVEFMTEWRFFILDREIRTYSIYMHMGKPAIGPLKSYLDFPAELMEAKDFLRAFLADESILIPKSVVIDVGRLVDGRYAIIEANPSYMSGMYACDPRQVLEVIAGAVI